MQDRQRDTRQVSQGNGSKTVPEEQADSLDELARRLSSRVAWQRMSAAATRRALGLPPPACRERSEYDDGCLDRAAGCRRPRSASLAYRTGYRVGPVPKRGRKAAQEKRS